MLAKKFRHLCLEDRKTIANCVSHGVTESETARRIGVSPSTVGREVKRHAYYAGASRAACPILRRWPYTCDGCRKFYGKGCVLGKKKYDAVLADGLAKRDLSEPRKGIDMGEAEFAGYDERLRKAVAEDGESVYSASFMEGMPSKSTIYRHVASGAVSLRPSDLPMAAKLKKRKKAEREHEYGGSYASKAGHQYVDYLRFARDNPGLFAWEFDFLGAPKSSRHAVLVLRNVRTRVTLTAKLRKGSAGDVASFFGLLREKLGPEGYARAFPVLLTDNEPCFSCREAIELDPVTGEVLASVFYCHPYASTEKGSVEATNGRIRDVIPKGESVDDWKAEEVSKVGFRMNGRRNRDLGSATPKEAFCEVYGEDAYRAIEEAFAEWDGSCDKSGKLH